MSPLYWRAVQNGLIDMIRQCGYPKIFMTTAPYKPSFPNHVFVQDQLEKTQRSRGHLALPEALHMAHVLRENVRGFVTGVNSSGDGPARNARVWKRHLLNGAPEPPQKRARVAVMSRLEYQDGTRKPTSQDYHGSGLPHDHSIVCLERPEDGRLDAVASATLPPTGTPLRA